MSQKDNARRVELSVVIDGTVTLFFILILAIFSTP